MIIINLVGWVGLGWVGLGFMAYQPLLVILCRISLYIYIYISNKSKPIFLEKFLNEPELIFFHTVKWFHLFLIRIIQFIMNYLFAHCSMFSSIAIHH